MDCKTCSAYFVCGVTTDPNGTACQKFQKAQQKKAYIILDSSLSLEEAEKKMDEQNTEGPVREAIWNFYKGKSFPGGMPIDYPDRGGNPSPRLDGAPGPLMRGEVHLHPKVKNGYLQCDGIPGGPFEIKGLRLSSLQNWEEYVKCAATRTEEQMWKERGL